MNSPKSKFKEFFTMIILTTILLTFILLFRVVQHTFSLSYAEGDFDWIIQGYTENQINEIKNLPFVKEIYPTRILSGEIEKENTKMEIDIYAANSFEGREVSFFSDKLLIKKNQKLLDDVNENPIIIDKKIATTLNVGIGDLVSIKFGVDSENVNFKVAAITEPMEKVLGISPGLILWRGEQQQAFLDSFKENPEYSYMFVKVNNTDESKKYFLNNYIPLQFFTQDDSSDEIIEYNQVLNFNREAKLEDLQYELRYTPPIIIIASILGFITFLLIMYRESNKKMIVLEKNFSILYSLGLPRFYFILYSIIENAILQIPVIVCSALIVKYLIYDTVINTFLPWYLFKWFCLGALMFQLFAVIINAIFLYFKLIKNNPANLLTKE